MEGLTREAIEAAFREMGELLLRDRKIGEVAVYGGAAILLQFTGRTSVEALLGLHRRFFPDRPLDPRRVAVVGEVARRAGDAA